MKEITAYAAIDGKYFFNKTLCDKYEKTLLSEIDKKGSVIFLNELWDILKTDNDVYSRIDNCRYIIVTNQEGADFLKLFSDNFLKLPCGIGLWTWDYSLGMFIKVSSSNILKKMVPPQRIILSILVNLIQLPILKVLDSGVGITILKNIVMLLMMK